MKFSFIIPALNEEDYLAECVKSIQVQIGSSDEIVVVDNGSSDRTAKIARKLGCRVYKEARRGISYARNKGAEMARGDVFCFIDADGILSKNWLKESKKALSDRDVVAVSGLNLLTHKSLIKKVWYNLYTLAVYFNVLILNFFFSRLYLVGNNLAIRKKFFWRLGGWEPFVAEDYWLTRKFWQSGRHKGVFNPGMLIHYSSRGFDKAGYWQTIYCWLKSIYLKRSQSGYTYQTKRF